MIYFGKIGWNKLDFIKWLGTLPASISTYLSELFSKEFLVNIK